jgi:hypothetical protein
LAVSFVNIWSVVIHPTLNKIYCLSHLGDLYVFNFTPGSLPSTPPVLPSATPSATYLNLYDKFATLEVLDTTTLLLRTDESLSFFDLGSHTFTWHFNRKPTSSRSIPGTDFFLLTYHNWRVKLYNAAAHSVDSSFTPLTGTVKEIAVSPATSSVHEVYVLFADRIDVYSYSLGSGNVLIFVTSKTQSQILADLIPVSSVVSIERMMDITVLLLSPNPIVVLLYVGTSIPSYRSALVLFSPTTMTMVPSSFILFGSAALYSIAVPIVDTATSQDFIYTESNDLYISRIWSGSGWTSAIIGDMHTTIDPTYWPLLSRINPIKIPYFTKTTSLYDQTSINSYLVRTEGYFQLTFARDSVIGSRDLSRREVFQDYRIALMDHIRGNFTKNSFAITQYSATLIELFSPILIKSWSMDSSLIMGTIPYQIANNSIFVTDGDSNLYYFSFDDCYLTGMYSDYELYNSMCDVLACISCNFFNRSQCKVCNTGFYLTSIGQCMACPDYILNGTTCVTSCPLEQYKLLSSSPKQCISDTNCKLAGNYILGDRCITTPCPASSFSANTSNFCLPTDSTTAATYNDDTLAVSICPAGSLYFLHYRQCTPVASLPTPAFKYTLPTASAPGYIYCDFSAGYYYDIASKRCLPSCGLYRGVHPDTDRFCASAPDCRTLSYFTDDVTSFPGLDCVPSCPASLWTDMTTKSCVVACPSPGSLSLSSSKTCVASCPNSLYSTPTQCLTKSECETLAQLPILSSMQCVSGCTSGGQYNSTLQE